MQSAFLKDVQSLTVVMQDMGNPFLEERKDFFGSRHQIYHGISSWDRNESDNHWPGSVQQVCR